MSKVKIYLWHPEVVTHYKKRFVDSDDLIKALKAPGSMYDLGSPYGFAEGFELTGTWGVDRTDSDPAVVWAEVKIIDQGLGKTAKAYAEWFFFQEEYVNVCEK